MSRMNSSCHPYSWLRRSRFPTTHAWVFMTPHSRSWLVVRSHDRPWQCHDSVMTTWHECARPDPIMFKPRGAKLFFSSRIFCLFRGEESTFHAHFSLQRKWVRLDSHPRLCLVFDDALMYIWRLDHSVTLEKGLPFTRVRNLPLNTPRVTFGRTNNAKKSFWDFVSKRN